MSYTFNLTHTCFNHVIGGVNKHWHLSGLILADFDIGIPIFSTSTLGIQNKKRESQTSFKFYPFKPILSWKPL